MNVQYCCKVERANIFTRLNKDFHSDLYWWYFIGLSILRNAKSVIPANFHIQTDASGSWGRGDVRVIIDLVVIVQKVGTSRNNNKGVSTNRSELCSMGPYFTRCITLFQCDNLGLIAAITTGSPKDITVMHLL